MIYKKLSLLILFFATGLLTASAQKSPQDMDRFIDALMKKMTTEDNIGRLNLPVTGESTTRVGDVYPKVTVKTRFWEL